MNQRTRSHTQNPLKAAVLAVAAGTAILAGPSALAAADESRSVNTTSDGQNTVRVESVGGAYTITLNGKEVKRGSVSDAWKSFDLVDTDGASVGAVTRNGDDFTITLDGEGVLGVSGFPAGDGMHVNRARVELDAASQPRIARAYAMVGLAPSNEPAPKTMLGVTLEAPGDAVCAHLGINRENATMLTSVTDGLPASKAGLKQYDVITEINNEPASPDTVRRLLREKNAGDTLAVKVIRAGERKDFTINLEPYDAARLNTMTFSTAGNAWAPAVQIDRLNLDGAHGEFEARAKAMEDLARTMREKADAFGSSGTAGGKAIEDLHEQMQQLAVEMEKRAEELGKMHTGEAWNWQGTGQGGVIIGRRGSRGSAPLVFPVPAAPALRTTPTPPGAGSPASGADLAALQTRLDRTDERLAKLAELLEQAVQQKSPSAGGSGAKDR